MKLIRYLDDSGKIQYAAEQAGGARLRIEGDPFGKNRVTQEPAKISKVLAPVVPVMIWCIGQNYRRHADEVGMSSGDYPVAFTKGVSSLQDPGAPIAIPTRAGTTGSTKQSGASSPSLWTRICSFVCRILAHFYR